MRNWSDALPATFALDLQASGRLSARFGERRVLNGKESAPHAGLDLAIGTGTPLRAPAADRVATDDYFYSGKSVFVDHGQGFTDYLISTFCSLCRIFITAGRFSMRSFHAV